MKEYSAEHPRGVNRGPRRVLGGPRNVTLRYMDETVVTSIPKRFTGGCIEGADNRFNGKLVRKPQTA